MGREKGLKNIAHGLLGTFVSRNNDIDGYWGIGVLRLYASQRGLAEINLNLLKPSAAWPDSSPTTQAEKMYARWLKRALARTALSPEELSKVDIDLRFSTFAEFPNAIRYTRGEPYQCTVTFARTNGWTYTASTAGVCEPHDPRKEHQRAGLDEA